MFKLILLVCTVQFLSCTDSRQKQIESNTLKDTTLQILVTGLPDLEAITQMNFLAKRYRFAYSSIGCVVAKSRMDSIQKVNASAYNVLEGRFGKGWKPDFYSQFDIIHKVRQQADSIINSQLKSNDKGHFCYLVMPDSIKNQYQIKAYSMDSINGKSELIVHYRITISLAQKVETHISKTFEKL